MTLVQTTEPGIVLGTVGYMSPEQVRGEEADHRSDIFAFGCLLYEMLSGQRAFRKQTSAETLTAIIKEEPTGLAEMVPALSPGLERILQRCLEKEPDRRFQSSSDLAFGLEGLAGSSGALKVTSAGASPRGSRFVQVIVVVSALLLLILAFLIGRWQSPAPEPPTVAWRGERLGGPAVASGPVVSPDGSEVAFRAMDDGLTQVAVMLIGSGDWKLLTTNRNRGLVDGVCWSRNGAEIFFDRLLGVPVGVFRISKYGGEERLVLKNAYHPELLPDDSLLVSRVSTNRLRQLHRYWLDGRLEPLNAFTPHGEPGSCSRAMPGGKEVVFFGWVQGEFEAPMRWWILDLPSGRSKALPKSPPALLGEWHNPPMLGHRVDNSLLYVEPAGNAFQIVSVDRQTWAAKRPLMTLTMIPSLLDVGLDGSLFLDQIERPIELLRVTRSKESHRIPLSANFESSPVLPLPDGRFLLPSRMAGQYRLMALTPGQQPTPFIQYNEQSREPIGLLGADKLLCRLGGSSNWVVAVVSASDGRVIKRLPAIPADRRLTRLAGSPDGTTIYYVAAGVVWSVPVAGGQPQKIRDGDGVAPDTRGEYLIIQVNRAEGNSLVRWSLSNGTETPLPTKYPLTSDTISPNAVGKDGRIALSVAPGDSWFWLAAILDPATGEMEIVPERHADMITPGWDFDGDLVTTAQFFRSNLWRFRPEK